MMTGSMTKADGWMNYHLQIDGETKRSRVYWRNHNKSYIKRNGAWVRIFFNHWVLDGGDFIEIPMIFTDGEWAMRHEYAQVNGNGHYIIANAPA